MKMKCSYCGKELFSGIMCMLCGEPLHKECHNKHMQKYHGLDDVISLKRWISESQPSQNEIIQRVLDLAEERVDRFLSNKKVINNKITTHQSGWEFYGFVQVSFGFPGAFFSDTKFAILSAGALEELEILPSIYTSEQIESILQPHTAMGRTFDVDIKRLAMGAIAAVGVGTIVGLSTGDVLTGIVGAGSAVMLNLLSDYVRNPGKYKNLSNEEIVVLMILKEGDYTISELLKRFKLVERGTIRKILKNLEKQGLAVKKGKLLSENIWSAK